MIRTLDFTINELQISDASALSILMAGNASRFQRDFPLTLAQNLTAAASLVYIQKKEKEIASKSEFTWAIRDNRTRAIAGLIILKEIDWEKCVGEFAYCVGVDFEGRGWVTETVQKLSKYAFNELGLKTLQIIAHETNMASLRVAEKCGFLWQKKLLKSYTPPNSVALDMELYERYAE